jgi:hypothetical protein
MVFILQLLNNKDNKDKMSPDDNNNTKGMYMKSFSKKAMLVAATMLVSGVLTSISASAQELGTFSHGDCRDQAVSLVCKVNGHMEQVTAYTDCGIIREGGYCSTVYTPGLDQRRMRVEWRCENGNLEWVLGNRGWCELSYRH